MKGVLLEPQTRCHLKREYYASYKLDGIRAVINCGVSYSNSGKPLPSARVQTLSKELPEGLDGEWVYGDPAAEGCLELTKSAVMSLTWPAHLSRSLLRFYVFDVVNSNTFHSRQQLYRGLHLPSFVTSLDQTLVVGEAGIDAFYERAVSEGYEGVILKCPNSHYKHGRATAKEATYWKMKPFGTDKREARIIGWYPMERSIVESTTGSLGLSERSYRQDSKEEVKMLGGWLVQDCVSGVRFKIGGGRGMTHDKRAEWYLLGDKLLGSIVQYTTMQYGEVDKPRSPQFRGLRSSLDITGY
jgi:ATP-dependent DNA ligase